LVAELRLFDPWRCVKTCASTAREIPITDLAVDAKRSEHRSWCRFSPPVVEAVIDGRLRTQPEKQQNQGVLDDGTRNLTRTIEVWGS
jgi:hypothetical protein